ncbi:EGF-like domain-containing protein 2 isoform X1 [Octopus bimaculoides]|uniref:EGF-like domain-containing protein 2 isoform X1 n=1 Tax=Octopus bimaculoides TaxID=37653 RepID=UPI00071D09C2|nr:EGF-like domain-containing protein 2 isoform X1 [Octopus bimaculoides]|eukprot:XP_014769934.1 PREDICTED: EGF-like domain-containing protein 2 isoform X2 [Octopus bimaculoides]
MYLLEYIQPLLMMTLIYSQKVDFDCRRWGVSCAKNGRCLTTSNYCECSNNYTGHDCGLLTFSAHEPHMLMSEKSWSSSISPSPNCGGLKCQNGGTCVTANETFYCYCSPSFYGDRCESSRVAVDCQSTQMSIKIAPFGQFTGKIFVKDFEDNPNCSFNNMGDVWELNLDYFSGCGAGIEGQTVFSDIPKIGDVSFKREIVVLYNQDIMNSFDELHTVSCQHNLKMVIDPMSMTSNVVEDSNLTKTDTKNIYNPIGFEIKDTNGDPLKKAVFVGDKVQLTFILWDNEVFNDFHVSDCEAFEAGGGHSSIKLIENSCVNKNAFSVIAGDLKKDGAIPMTISLLIRAFRFVKSPAVSFRCNVIGCKPDDDTCSSLSCRDNSNAFGRKRRDVGGVSGAIEVTDGKEQKTLSKTLYVRELSIQNMSTMTPPEDCLAKNEFITMITCLGAVVLVLLILCGVLIYLVRRKRTEKDYNGEVPQKSMGIVDFKIPRVTN